MLKHLKSHDSRGDTIVEVLIALTVLTTVLVGAYVTASRSQNANRAAQEQSEAIRIAESQIERLKVRLATGNSLPPPAEVYCIKEDNTGTVSITPPATNPFLQNLANATFPYPGECGNKGGRYNVAIRSTTVDANTTTYEFLVRWTKAGGGNTQIRMFYRTY